MAPADSRRTQFSAELGPLHLKPLWERAIRLAPGSAAVPCLRRWREARPHLLKAAELITTDEAERRVLMLENPGLPGSTFATGTLYAGLQIILPGEKARTHRHTPSALRFMLEGTGAYTTVDGERASMQPGDFVTTPAWSWHDHGNEGTEPAVWLDGLDTAFANFLGAHFREDYRQAEQAPSRPEDDSSARYGPGRLPIEHRSSGRNPLLHYPYARTREALERLARQGDPDAAHGHRLRYADPSTGGHAFRTMSAFMQWLPRGFAGRAWRSTGSFVYCVAQGRARVTVGDASWAVEPHDVFAVPPWTACRFSAEVDCVLFSYSDRAAQEALGFWREQAG